MSCLSRAHLAEAVTEMRDEVSLHVSSCHRCRERFDELAAVGKTIRTIPTSTVGGARADMMLRAVFAQLDTQAPPAARTWPWLLVAVAAAAAVVLALTMRDRTPAIPWPAPIANAPVFEQHAAPKPPSPAIEDPRTQHARVPEVPPHQELPTRSPRIPAPHSPPLDPARTIDDSRFGATSDVVAPALTRDNVKPTVPSFADGWTLLSAKSYREAIVAFDAVRDPDTREDAAYWAAIACTRSGLQHEAATRLAAFISSFPASTRRASAEKLLATMRR